MSMTNRTVRMKVCMVFYLLIFSVLGLKAQNDSMELPFHGKEFNDLIPAGWRVLSQASGDLNQDGYPDLAFALQNTLKEHIEYNDGLGIDTLDLNPRVLGIYFGQADKSLEKVLQSDEFIIICDAPTMDEPFDGLQILPDGELQIKFHLWYSAGSWSSSFYQYSFRYQNQAFELIGFERSEHHRGTGDEIDHSIDFQNRTMKIISTTLNEDTEEQDSEVLNKAFELQQLKSIKTLGKPFEWKFQEISI
ncbi:FG-GAP repeat protein [Reichenbachiella ulvae]|uniref:Uncharacterized protein n=1 Tax=Reichenbachiella ulvae TaxID=2980104 RepID=A0ABT3CUP0_9BACT|nr:FG-GAP repeat protein [Reichenbachiella ulvae]MCV9387393.1 hypothetical protein [Reichenbachiella ulvae]